MRCTIDDLKKKDVINRQNGSRIGCVDDIEIDACSARVLSIVIYGPSRVFGLLGREEDYIIPWEDIELIGEDTIIVKGHSSYFKEKRKKSFFGNRK